MGELILQKLGNYIILDEIGGGGSGKIFRAIKYGSMGFEKIIALKKIKDDQQSQERAIKAFIEEARLSAFFEHENIVRINDLELLDGHYYIAMEYLAGQNLKDLIKKKKAAGATIDLESSLYIISQVCLGLDHAHNLKNHKEESLNVIHRDITPSNIFITYNGQVKILDFGVAKADNREMLTPQNFLKGTYSYMSPEQAAGEALDRRSDIFSIGINLYELVTGTRMFTGNSYVIINKIIHGIYDPPTFLEPGILPMLNATIEKAIAKNPDDRYQNCLDMHDDLKQCIRELNFHPSNLKLSYLMDTLFKKEIEEEKKTRKTWAEINLNEIYDDKNKPDLEEDSFEPDSCDEFDPFLSPAQPDEVSNPCPEAPSLQDEEALRRKPFLTGIGVFMLLGIVLAIIWNFMFYSQNPWKILADSLASQLKEEMPHGNLNIIPKGKIDGNEAYKMFLKDLANIGFKPSVKNGQKAYLLAEKSSTAYLLRHGYQTYRLSLFYDNGPDNRIQAEIPIYPSVRHFIPLSILALIFIYLLHFFEVRAITGNKREVTIFSILLFATELLLLALAVGLFPRISPYGYFIVS